jgi:hypothetical protein
MLNSVRLFSSTTPPPSWTNTNNDELVQKLTTTRLVHEVSLQQMELASSVVPWFMKNMPVRTDCV